MTPSSAPDLPIKSTESCTERMHTQVLLREARRTIRCKTQVRTLVVMPDVGDGLIQVLAYDLLPPLLQHRLLRRCRNIGHFCPCERRCTAGGGDRGMGAKSPPLVSSTPGNCLSLPAHGSAGAPQRNRCGGSDAEASAQSATFPPVGPPQLAEAGAASPWAL